MNDKVTVFEIPHLLQLICSTLYPNEVLLCLCVCKQWKEIFYPYLWRDINDAYEKGFKEWILIPNGLELLLANCHYIRKLSLCDTRLALVLQGARCTNLTRLRIQEQMPRINTDAVLNLIERNPRLEEIKMDYTLFPAEKSDRFNHAIYKLPRLKKLSVDSHVDDWNADALVLQHLPLTIDVFMCGPESEPESSDDEQDMDNNMGMDEGMETDEDDSDEEGDTDDDDEFDEEFEHALGDGAFNMGDFNPGDFEFSSGSEGSDEGDMTGEEDEGNGSEDEFPLTTDDGLVQYNALKKDTSDRHAEDTENYALTGLYIDTVITTEGMLQFLRFIERCPKLLHFGVPSANDGNLEVLARVLRENCPLLEAINFTQEFDSDAPIPILLQASRGLTQIRMRHPSGLDLTSRTTLGIMTHSTTLTSVDIQDGLFTSTDIQLLLVSCSHLKSFGLKPFKDLDDMPEFTSRAGPSGTLRFKDMVSSDWACLRLKHLCIRLSDDCGESTKATEKAMIRKVYRQLGRLTELQVLDVGVYHEVVPPLEGDTEEDGPPMELVKSDSGLNWTINSGLNELAPLASLEGLVIRDGTETLAVAEAKWMCKNWTQLAVVKGFPKTNDANAKAAEWLSKQKPGLMVR